MILFLSVHLIYKREGEKNYEQINFRIKIYAGAESREYAIVTGTRSARHTHPKGQLLIETEGSGLIQQWGEPVRKIQKGDVIGTPANIKHLHGASAKATMTHTAINEGENGKVVDWMEKVTDGEYGAPAQ